MECKRVSAKQAGYMELPGAYKNSDCKKVDVKGGISLSLGCCDLFEPEAAYTRAFKCGTCEYKTPKVCDAD